MQTQTSTPDSYITPKVYSLSFRAEKCFAASNPGGATLAPWEEEEID